MRRGPVSTPSSSCREPEREAQNRAEQCDHEQQRSAAGKERNEAGRRADQRRDAEECDEDTKDWYCNESLFRLKY